MLHRQRSLLLRQGRPLRRGPELRLRPLLAIVRARPQRLGIGPRALLVRGGGGRDGPEVAAHARELLREHVRLQRGPVAGPLAGDLLRRLLISKQAAKPTRRPQHRSPEVVVVAVIVAAAAAAAVARAERSEGPAALAREGLAEILDAVRLQLRDAREVLDELQRAAPRHALHRTRHLGPVELLAEPLALAPALGVGLGLGLEQPPRHIQLARPVHRRHALPRQRLPRRRQRRVEVGAAGERAARLLQLPHLGLLLRGLRPQRALERRHAATGRAPGLGGVGHRAPQLEVLGDELLPQEDHLEALVAQLSLQRCHALSPLEQLRAHHPFALVRAWRLPRGELPLLRPHPLRQLEPPELCRASGSLAGRGQHLLPRGTLLLGSLAERRLAEKHRGSRRGLHTQHARAVTRE